MDLKVISYKIFSHYDLCSIIIKTSGSFFPLHFQIFSVMHKTDVVHIISLGTKTDRNCITFPWLHRCTVIFRPVTEHCVFI